MPTALYWDASAILSYLAEDRHSAEARRRSAIEVPHLISSLALAEVSAVLARLVRAELLRPTDRDQAIRSLQARPWSALHLAPDPQLTTDLATRHRLRGADLWHLATAATLALEVPGIELLTFDRRLADSAERERLAAS